MEASQLLFIPAAFRAHHHPHPWSGLLMQPLRQAWQPFRSGDTDCLRDGWQRPRIDRLKRMQNRLPETFALLHCLFEDGFPTLWPMLGLRCATSAAQWLHCIDSKLTGHAQGIIKTPSRQRECQSQPSGGLLLLFTRRLSELQACTINEHCFPEATATIGNGETVADSPA